MRLPQIRMESVMARIGLVREKPVQSIEQPKAIVTIRQPKAILEIETERENSSSIKRRLGKTGICKIFCGRTKCMRRKPIRNG